MLNKKTERTNMPQIPSKLNLRPQIIRLCIRRDTIAGLFSGDKNVLDWAIDEWLIIAFTVFADA
ncbi:MAG: hypothetical protein ACKO7B_16385, partial [Flavobacteriales bacterium]